MTINPDNLLTPISPPEEDPPKPSLRSQIYHRLETLPWQMWAVIVIVLSGGAGFTATTLLFKLPKSPECTRVFWPFASASMRLYCAQLSADRRTVEGLLQAIKLVEGLSADHPLRHEADRYIEEWAGDILDLAEENFQSGNLEEAIAIANKIPSHVAAHGLVAERIAQWQAIWEKGQGIFADVEEQLRESNWNQAFREAIKLLNLKNRYFSTQKYDETVQAIQLAQEESRKLDSAYGVLRRGGVENWLAAIASAQKVPSISYAYREAQKLIKEGQEKLVDYLAEQVEQRQWPQVLELANRLPSNLTWDERVEDWKILASASMEAEVGTVESLENAIATAQTLEPSRPLYNDIQERIGRWQLEIEDVKNLDAARNQAQGGSPDNLKAAIAQAQLVPPDHPRYNEATRSIKDWTQQIQTLEDQPLLDRARALANPGQASDLQAAIAQATTIQPNRALYAEAQSEIRQWRGTIERQEDQPLLDQAQALANSNDYGGAIAVARQIRQGRALYSEAQGNIGRWQGEIQAQRNLQDAKILAQAKTPEALGSALRILRRIPSTSQVSSQRDQLMNSWSNDLLAMAQSKADSGFYAEGIQLATLVPQASSAYRSAQNQIAAWRQILSPPPVAPPVTPQTETIIPLPAERSP